MADPLRRCNGFPLLVLCLTAGGVMKAVAAASAACTDPPGTGVVPDTAWNCTLPAQRGATCTGFCTKGAQSNAPTAVCRADGSWVYRRGSCGSGTCKMRYMAVETDGGLVELLAAYVKTGWLVPIMNTMLGVCGDLCKQRVSFGGFLSEDVSLLNFKLVGMSLVDSPSSKRRRQLLAQAGALDRLVVGYQLACGNGYFPLSLEPVLDAALNTATASGYIGGALIRVLQIRKELPETFDATKILLAAADSSGATTTKPVPAAMCQVLLPAATNASLAAGFLSVESIPSNAYDATIVMCGGPDRLTPSVMFKSYSVSGRVDFTAEVPDNSQVQCAVSPASLSGAANGTMLRISCSNKNGARFNVAKSYGILVKADYGCGFASDKMMVAASRLNVSVAAAPKLSLVPWDDTKEGGGPAAVCGGKPATAKFRYKVQGLIKGQKFTVTGDAGPACTVVTEPVSRDTGIATVTCSGAFAPGATVNIRANITVGVQSCAVLSEVATSSVPVMCCSTGASYAKAGSAASCYKHLKPATQAAQCSKRAAAGTGYSYGYANRGPSSAVLYLADDAAISCMDKVMVGSASMTCVNIPGKHDKQLQFAVTVPTTHRAAQIRYMVSCSAPKSNTQCPPDPSWPNVRNGPAFQDLMTTIQGNNSVTTFTVQARCHCKKSYWGVYHTAAYRNLPLAACGL